MDTASEARSKLNGSSEWMPHWNTPPFQKHDGSFRSSAMLSLPVCSTLDCTFISSGANRFQTTRYPVCRLTSSMFGAIQLSSYSSSGTMQAKNTLSRVVSSF